MYGFPSSRIYPRTISGTNAAFPGTPEYAAALVCPPTTQSALTRVAIAFVLVAACAVLGALAAEVPL